MPDVQVNREELPGKEAPAQRAVCSGNRGWELTELSNVRTRERVLRRPIRAAAAHPRGWEEEANPLSTASFSPDNQQCPPFQARVRGVSFAANTSRGSRHFQTQELREQRPSIHENHPPASPHPQPGQQPAGPGPESGRTAPDSDWQRSPRKTTLPEHLLRRDFLFTPGPEEAGISHVRKGSRGRALVRSSLFINPNPQETNGMKDWKGKLC